MSNNCFVQKVLGVSSNKFIETPTSVDLEFSQSDKNIGYFEINTPRDNLSVLQGNIDIINSHTPKITEKTILRISDPTKVKSIEPGTFIEVSNLKRLLFLLMKGICTDILIRHKGNKTETIILEELFKQNMTKVFYKFVFYGNDLYGNISTFALRNKLNRLDINSSNVSGDISSLANLTELTVLGLCGTQVSGDITNIVINLTKLNSLSIPRTVTITDEQKKTLTDRGCSIYIG